VVDGDGPAGLAARPAFAPGRELALIGLGAVAVRVAYTVVLGQHVELGLSDASFYSAAANHLAAGDGFVDIWRTFAEHGVGGEPIRTAHHPPGWPALLSIASLLGVESQLGHRLVGALVGGIVVVLIGVLARHVAGRAAGLVAAGIAALHPTLVAADGSVMSETLAGAGVLAIVLTALAVWRAPDVRLVALLGVLVGAAALVRGEGLLYGPILAVPVAWLAARRAGLARRDVALRVGVVIAAGALVVLPWTVRNTLLFDEVVLISINDSTVLAGANCPSTYAGPGLGGWDVRCVAPVGGTEVEEASVWRQQGLDHIRANLDRLPAVVAARLARTAGLWEPLDANAEARHAGVQAVGNVVWLALLAPGAVAGAVVLARRRRSLELSVLLAPVAAVLVVTVVGFGMLRFRHSAELVAIVLTAVAATSLAARWRR
jgi:4-amino-4-deoxy-L-arabinose transferase-like glycosyltransferase